MMLGAALTMEVLSQTPIDDALIDQLTDFLLHGLRREPLTDQQIGRAKVVRSSAT